jgi:MOSC domain-containing protein YiiM
MTLLRLSLPHCTMRITISFFGIEATTDNLKVHRKTTVTASRIVSIQIGQVEEIPDDSRGREPGNVWRSAIRKRPVSGSIPVLTEGLQGDERADGCVHGGPDKAVLAYSIDHRADWQSQLGLDAGQAGGFGENFTVSGDSEETVCVGDVVEIGSAILQVSQPRQPCWKLSRRWNCPQLVKKVARSGWTGWYYRVLQEGEVEAGIECKLVDRLHPDWTIARSNRVLFHGDLSVAQMQGLSKLNELAESWKRDLLRRLTANF